MISGKELEEMAPINSGCPGAQNQHTDENKSQSHNVQMIHKVTPTDISSFESLNFCHSVPIYLREEKTNVITHNAKNLFAFMVRREELGPYTYLATATDADPFGYKPGGWYNNASDEIKQAHKLRSGRTGKQGSGKIASAICLSQSNAGFFCYKNFNLITFSESENGHCVVSTFMEPEDENIHIYRLISEDKPEWVDLIKEIIDGFCFEDNAPVRVLHLARCGASNLDGEESVRKGPLSMNNIIGFNEFCRPIKQNVLNLKCCYRGNYSSKSMSEIFEKQGEEKNIYNRISGGVSVSTFEKMYSLFSVEEKDMEVSYEYKKNCLSYKVDALVDVKITLYPGIRYEKTNDDKSRKPNKKSRIKDNDLVTLRDVDVAPGESGRQRAAGVKGGHDVADSGHRILLSMENHDERPSKEAIFTVHDTDKNHPHNYTEQSMGYRPTDRTKLTDVEEFISNCKKLEKEQNFVFEVSYDKIINESEKDCYFRSPFLKIWINCTKSKVEINPDTEESFETSVLAQSNLNNCFYTSSPDIVQNLIKESLRAFTKKDQFLIFEQIHKLLFPKTQTNEINTVSIDLIYGHVEDKIEKVTVLVPKT